MDSLENLAPSVNVLLLVDTWSGRVSGSSFADEGCLSDDESAGLGRALLVVFSMEVSDLVAVSAHAS